MNTIAYKLTNNIIDEHMIKKACPGSWKAIIEFDSLEEATLVYRALQNKIEELLLDARNNHLWALGSNTQEEATFYEEKADEQRKRAYLLKSICNNLDRAFHCSEYTTLDF